MAEAGSKLGDTRHVVWSTTVDPSVVTCTAEPVASNHADAFSIERLSSTTTTTTTTIVGTSGSEHLSISNGFQRIRLDIVSGTLLRGPVRLHYRLAGFDDTDAQLLRDASGMIGGGYLDLLRGPFGERSDASR